MLASEFQIKKCSFVSFFCRMSHLVCTWRRLVRWWLRRNSSLSNLSNDGCMQLASMNGYLRLRRRVSIGETLFVEFTSRRWDLSQLRLKRGEKTAVIFSFVHDQSKFLVMLENVSGRERKDESPVKDASDYQNRIGNSTIGREEAF